MLFVIVASLLFRHKNYLCKCRCWCYCATASTETHFAHNNAELLVMAAALVVDADAAVLLPCLLFVVAFIVVSRR